MSIRGARGKARGRKFACQNWITLLTPYLFCCPFPWLWWKLFPQSLSLSESSYEKRRIDPHTVSTRKGRREGGGVLAFLSGIEDPLSSRWVMVDGEDDRTLVG